MGAETQWSNRCDLCRSTRQIDTYRMLKPNHVLNGWPIVECPWCRAVRMKYGSYWYPVPKAGYAPRT